MIWASLITVIIAGFVASQSRDGEMAIPILIAGVAVGLILGSMF